MTEVLAGTSRALAVVMLSRWVASTVTVTYLSLSLGCLSNEYVISQPELARLASLPPGQRGAAVHVVQSLGSRETEPVDNAEPLPEDRYVAAYSRYDLPLLDDRLVLPLPTNNRRAPSTPWQRKNAVSQPAPRSGNGGVSPSGHGGWGSGSGGGGGGNGSGEALLVLAVVVVAVAALAAAGLAVTEGIRYDGTAQLHPEQPLRLDLGGGQEATVLLKDLTPLDVASSKSAVVADDELYGLRLGPRRPLDRKGMAFKVDFGSLSSLCACYSAVGLASNIQLGYFPHHRLGLLGTLSLGGGRNAVGDLFQRHSANLELQYFPLDWWRLHLGAFGHGGEQVAEDEFGRRTGAAWGGGAILELALTTRLALTARMDYTLADTAPGSGGWASSAVFSGGLAIY